MEEYETEDNAMLTDIPAINSTVEKVLRVLLSTTQQPIHAGNTAVTAAIGVMLAIAVVIIGWLLISKRRGNGTEEGTVVTVPGGLMMSAALGAPPSVSIAQHYVSASAAVRDDSEPVLLSQSPREDIELQGGPSSSQAPLLETESNLPQSDSLPDNEDKPVENVQRSSYPDKDSNLVEPPPNRAVAIDGSPPTAYTSRPDLMASRKPSFSSDDRSTQEGRGDRHTSISTDGEDFTKSTSLPCAESKPSGKHRHYLDPEINFISAPPTPNPTSSFDLFSKNSSNSTRYRRSSSNSDSEQPLLNQSYNTSNNTSQFNHDRNNKNGHV